MIVDTSYILDLLDGDQSAFEKGQQLTEANISLKVPTMTIVELFVGYGATENEEEARHVENAILGHPILPLDETIAQKAGWIAGQTGLDYGDASIGATAVHFDEPVLTANVADFEQIDGVSIETY
ncbi:PIN domain-containing protein [Halomicrococcus sp. NG-SE-24]|uniref:PIN domain-containing protein n=1 Tax=Halomicrococcus sp. NG-SE-24 TaxID=3436928 RepID=UPI003D99CCC2